MIELDEAKAAILQHWYADESFVDDIDHICQFCKESQVWAEHEKRQCHLETCIVLKAGKFLREESAQHGHYYVPEPEQEDAVSIPKLDYALTDEHIESLLETITDAVAHDEPLFTDKVFEIVRKWFDSTPRRVTAT